MSLDKPFNKDLVLREKLALQRTILANQTTLLAFLRTSLYFFIAGLSLESLLKVDYHFRIEMFFFLSSFVLFCIGLFNYFKQNKLIRDNKKNIGNYKTEYFEQ